MTEETRERWWVMPAIASALTIGNVALLLAAYFINRQNCAPYVDANGRDMKVFHLTLSFLVNVVGLGVGVSWWPVALDRKDSRESHALSYLARWLTLAGCLLATLWTLQVVVDDPYC
jgi:hypothetical protein